MVNCGYVLTQKGLREAPFRHSYYDLGEIIKLKQSSDFRYS